MDRSDGWEGIVVPNGSVYDPRFATAIIKNADEAAWAGLNGLRDELALN